MQASAAVLEGQGITQSSSAEFGSIEQLDPAVLEIGLGNSNTGWKTGLELTIFLTFYSVGGCVNDFERGSEWKH